MPKSNRSNGGGDRPHDQHEGSDRADQLNPGKSNLDALDHSVAGARFLVAAIGPDLTIEPEQQRNLDTGVKDLIDIENERLGKIRTPGVAEQPQRQDNPRQDETQKQRHQKVGRKNRRAA